MKDLSFLLPVKWFYFCFRIFAAILWPLLKWWRLLKLRHITNEFELKVHLLQCCLWRLSTTSHGLHHFSCLADGSDDALSTFPHCYIPLILHVDLNFEQIFHVWQLRPPSKTPYSADCDYDCKVKRILSWDHSPRHIPTRMLLCSLDILYKWNSIQY